MAGAEDAAATHERRVAYKVALVGRAGTGKTAFLHQLTKGQFSSSFQPTAVDFQSWSVALPHGQHVTLQLWDIGGGASRKLLPTYVSNCQAVLAMYDICSTQSFAEVLQWLDTCRAASGGMLPYLALVACKCDLEGQRTVTEEDHQHLAHTLGMYSYCTSSLSGDGVKACACRIAADLAGVPLSLEQLEHMAGPCRELPGRGTAGSTIRQGGAVVDAVGGLDDLGGSSVGASSSKLPLSPAKAPAPAMTSRSGGKYGFIGPGLTEGTTNAGALVNPTMHMGTADTRAVQRAITPPRGPAGSSGNVRASSADATPRQSRPMLSRGTAGAGSGSGRMPLTQLDLAGHQAVAAAANGLNMGSLVFETEDGTGQEGAAGWGRDGAGGGRAVPGLATAVQAALSTSDGGKTGAGRRSGSFAGAPLPLPLQSRQQASAAVPLVAADGDAAVAPFTVAGPHHTNAQQQSSPHPVPLGVALQDPCTMYSSDWGAAKGDVGGEAGSMEHAALGVGQCGVCPAGATPPLLAEGKRKGGLRVLACCWG